MENAPFKISKAPDLPKGAANPAAGLMQATRWGGVQTDAHVVVGGGAKKTDNPDVNNIIADPGDDTYIDSVVEYSEDGETVTQANLSNLSDSREFMTVAPMLNCAIFAGGQDEKGISRVVEMYDSFGGHEVLTPLDTPRTDMASAGLGTNVLFAGGDDGTGATDRIDIYQINFMKRFAALKLNVAVKGLCGCTFGNYAVFAGGRTADGLPSNQVIAFDKNMNIISDIEPLSVPRYNLAAAVATNPENSQESYLLIAGGKSTHTGFSTVVDVYDINLKKVAAGLELTTGRSRLKGASCGGYALFAGGVVGVEPQDTPSDIIDIFNYKLMRFEPMHLSEAKNSLSAASFDNRVLFAGGYNAEGLSKTVDMLTLTATPAGYSRVTFDWSGDDHPDVGVPNPVIIRDGTPFTAPTPQLVSGWTFDAWYKDNAATEPWVDGTAVTDDITLYGKWIEGGGTSDVVNFAYTTNSEDKSAPIPNSILWPVNTRIYADDLPALPTPTVSTTTITGWYLDAQGLTLIDDSGVLVGEGGITLYCKSVNSQVHSVSFDYAMGRLDTETDPNYPMPESATAAWDAETLGDDSVLPTELITGEIGETVELPLADAMEALFAETDCEAEFKGWYPKPVASGDPITEVTIGGDTTVYALYEPKTEPEFVDVTYKIANVYIPKVEGGEIVPSDEKIAVEDAISLMPDIPCEFIGINSTADEVELSDYEWHDKVLKGSKYRLALPDNTTERTTDYRFGGYYSDLNCAVELGSVIEELNEDITVYCKFVPKSEVALPGEELTDTYNITFEVDGFAADSDVPSGGMMPPDMQLPDATAQEPVEIDHEAFPDLADEFIPKEMPASEGFKFVRWYYYDKDGNKVNYVPDETEITQDMVLHPEFEMVDLETETTVKLVELTPDIVGAPAELDWKDVPTEPFKGMVNPKLVTVGSTFDVSTITFPDLEDTFEVEGYYTIDTSGETPALVEFTTGTINNATTLYVRFNSTIAEPIDAIYHNDESTPEAELIVPDFDYELAAATTTTGGLDYEPRPADLVAVANAGINATVVISGYYSDSTYTTLFDPSATTTAGEEVNIYPKIETLSKVMVTVDYIPKVYSLTGSNFQFEIPTAPELPLNASTMTTYLFDASATGASILTAVGVPPIIQFWKAKNHEYGNCYWYTVASDASQIPHPFNPTGFTLTEPITLYPQFEADIHYPSGLIRRDDLHLSLTDAVSGAAAAGVSTGE